MLLITVTTKRDNRFTFKGKHLHLTNLLSTYMLECGNNICYIQKAEYNSITISDQKGNMIGLLFEGDWHNSINWFNDKTDTKSRIYWHEKGLKP